MGLQAGNVAAIDIAPPLDDKPDRVPIAEPHKRGVVDPVSALLMPVAGRGEPMDPENCNRILPVFDGASRFDVTLSVPGLTQQPDLSCAIGRTGRVIFTAGPLSTIRRFLTRYGL